jgi:hypothetical protein
MTSPISEDREEKSTRHKTQPWNGLENILYYGVGKEVEDVQWIPGQVFLAPTVVGFTLMNYHSPIGSDHFAPTPTCYSCKLLCQETF